MISAMIGLCWLIWMGEGHGEFREERVSVQVQGSRQQMLPDWR